jgi:BOP1NT (NUC169) domain
MAANCTHCFDFCKQMIVSARCLWPLHQLSVPQEGDAQSRIYMLLQWRTVYDEYNDEEVTLTKEEMQMIQRIRAGQFPHVEVRLAASLVS